MSAALVSQAERLRALHRPGTPLVLPNAWDAGSARAVADAGFPVVATTSAGVAAALGASDHEGLAASDMLAAVARIAAAVELPVTADLESGYGLGAEELVDGLLAAGAAGLNFEDTDHATGDLRDATEQAQRIAALRSAAQAAGVPVVINARVDVMARTPGVADPVAAILARARPYLAAGADCVFPILLSDETAIAAVVDALDAPVNVLLHPRAPPVARLAELGVARVSLGGGLHHAAATYVAERLAELRGAVDAGGSGP